MELLDKEAPWLLVVSPPCTMFSTLQGFSMNKKDEEEVRPKMKEAMMHVAFGVLLCLRQAKAGRKFVFEHPVGASSWQTIIPSSFSWRILGR